MQKLLYVEDMEAGHTEWAYRLPTALRFLLQRQQGERAATATQWSAV